MQNKRGTDNKSENRNTSYYKSRVNKKSKKSNYSFLDKSKKRQMSSYIRAVSVLFVFMLIVTGLIFLGIWLKTIVETDDTVEITTEEPSLNPPTQEIPTGEAEVFSEDENPLDSIPEIYSRYNGVYLDVRQLDSLESLQNFIDRIKMKDVNAVNIDIKTEEGIIPYNIGGTFTAVVGEENQIDLSLEDIINTLHDNGLYVSGTVVCFKDDLASTTHIMSALFSVSTDMRWVDASGSSWLNIYAESARDYVKNLIVECLKYGFDEIILSHFYLPKVENAGSLKYNDEGVGKTEAVTNFVRDIRNAIDDIDPKVKLGLHIPVRDFWVMPNDIMGVDPGELANKCNFFATSFVPAEAPAATLNIADPENDPFGTVSALCGHFQNLIDSVGFRPLIQAYNAYTDEQVNLQKQALREAGISVWSLVNYDNIY